MGINVAQHRAMPNVAHLVRAGMQVRVDECGGHKASGDYLLTLASAKQRSAGTLLGAMAAENVVIPNRIFADDPPAGAFCCFDNHVHAVGVARAIAKMDD